MPRPTRRDVLAGLAVAGAAGLVGCTDDGSPAATPTPISLSGSKQCAVCGMVVAEHPGPSALTSFAEHTPGGHDGPAWFDSVKEAFVYVWEKKRAGWEPTATYVTDYAAVDYELTDENGTTVVSRHVDPGTFARAADVVYVAGSEVVGAMGVDLLPFADRETAAAFRDEHGGWLVAHDEVTEETLERLREQERRGSRGWRIDHQYSTPPTIRSAGRLEALHPGSDGPAGSGRASGSPEQPTGPTPGDRTRV